MVLANVWHFKFFIYTYFEKIRKILNTYSKKSLRLDDFFTLEMVSYLSKWALNLKSISRYNGYCYDFRRRNFYQDSSRNLPLQPFNLEWALLECLMVEVKGLRNQQHQGEPQCHGTSLAKLRRPRNKWPQHEQTFGLHIEAIAKYQWRRMHALFCLFVSFYV